MSKSMKIGIIIPTATTVPFTPKLDFNEMKEYVLEAERLGYESIWFPDHLCRQDGKFLGERYECTSLLAAFAALTTKLRIGANVLCNLFRYPSILAKQVATIDIISGGRFELAIGSGWHKAEADAYGIPFPSFKVRSEMLRESLEVIKRMWLDDNPTFSGKYYSIDGAMNLPKPVQKPHPPIVIGGANPKYTLPTVAEYADEWNAYFISPDKYSETSETLDDMLEKVGRNPDDLRRSVFLPALTAPDDAGVKDLVSRLHGDDLKDGYESFSFFGVPETLSNMAQEYQDAGVDRLILYFMDFPDVSGLRVFAEDVMPEI